MQISPEGVTSRDEKVFRFAHEKKIPLIMLTSGSLNLKLLSYQCLALQKWRGLLTFNEPIKEKTFNEEPSGSFARFCI